MCIYRHFERSPEAKRRDDVRNPTLFKGINLFVGMGFLTPENNLVFQIAAAGVRSDVVFVGVRFLTRNTH